MSTLKRKPVKTLEPLTAFDRDKRRWALQDSYSRSHRDRPRPPRTKHELDILKERHQFVRSQDVDRATLSWEDQLAAKYYDSLFKEFAIVNLKHWKSGQIGMRWRTEDEVLSGVGHVTCASMRCAYHHPDPRIVAETDDAMIAADPDAARPLVATRLEESETTFGYVERGEKKSALVKVVLCRECGKRLRRGRELANPERARDARRSDATARRSEGSSDSMMRRGSPGSPEPTEDRVRRRSRSDPREGDDESRRPDATQRSRDQLDEQRTDGDGDGDDYEPALPPDMDRRSRSRPRSPSPLRRRSASPPPRRRLC
ncbi:hypothetical protein JCM11491_002172 [Sporobolomyces phaffii]